MARRKLSLSTTRHMYFRPSKQHCCRLCRDIPKKKYRQTSSNLKYRQHLRQVLWIKLCGGAYTSIIGQSSQFSAWLTYWDKQQLTLTFTSMGNLEWPINLRKCHVFWIVERSHKLLLHSNYFYNTVIDIAIVGIALQHFNMKHRLNCIYPSKLQYVH